jgi:hypothetical protein
MSVPCGGGDDYSTSLGEFARLENRLSRWVNSSYDDDEGNVFVVLTITIVVVDVSLFRTTRDQNHSSSSRDFARLSTETSMLSTRLRALS